MRTSDNLSEVGIGMVHEILASTDEDSLENSSANQDWTDRGI